MRAMLFALIACCLPMTAQAAAPDWRRMSTEALIDSLTEIDTDAPGVAAGSSWYGFIGDGDAQLGAALFGSRRPEVAPQMRELVRRGVDALPALIAHIQDARPSRLQVGDPAYEGWGFGGQFFGDEYEPRHDRWADPGCGGFCAMGEDPPVAKGAYTVRVGDFCFYLIGQIVDRGLSAVRYQPTAILVINSPIERPRLAERIRADWSGLTRDAHRQSLMDDIVASAATGRSRSIAAEALTRLRFYYPEAYARLDGEAGAAKAVFEADEAEERAREAARARP